MIWRWMILALITAVVGCSGSSSSDSAPAANTVAGVGGDPFADLLNYGVGTYTGSCMSISSGLAVTGKLMSLGDSGAFNGAEFTTTVSRENHILALSQKFRADKSTIDDAEWNASPVPNKASEGLLLRYNTNNVPTDNLAHARKEDPITDTGLSCNGAATGNLAKNNMFTVFSKYLQNPKIAFTQCYCSNGGGNPEIIPPAEFSSTASSVKIRASSLDLTKGFEEQMATYNSQTSDKNFIYTLKPTADTLVVYSFTSELKLSQFMAQFTPTQICNCQ